MSSEESQTTSFLDRYLVFSLGSEEYAIPLLRVREVIAVPETTPIPNSPPYFNGIMNLRGQVISVMDLRQKLGIKPDENKKENAVVIIDLNSTFIGVVVDSVDSVLSKSSNEINDVPEMENAGAKKYLTGVVRLEKNLILLLDIAKALNVQDIEALNKSKAMAA